MKVKLLIAAVSFLAALAAPSVAVADFNGDVHVSPVHPDPVVGPLASGVYPPVGCRWVEVWSIGHYPMVGLDPDYRFHMRLTWCWTASGWVSGEEYNASGRTIRRIIVQTWWSDLNSAVKSYSHETRVVPKYYTCDIEGTSFRHGCLRVFAQGQADIGLPPFLHIGTVTTHPWVDVRVDAEGEFLGADWDYAVL